MLNNIYLITAIAVALFTLSAMTITSFLWVNKSFRSHLEKILEVHEEKTKNWAKQLFLDYYYALDERLTNVNYRLKNIEKKCDKNHDH